MGFYLPGYDNSACHHHQIDLVLYCRVNTNRAIVGMPSLALYYVAKKTSFQNKKCILVVKKLRLLVLLSQNTSYLAYGTQMRHLCVNLDVKMDSVLCAKCH